MEFFFQEAGSREEEADSAREALRQVCVVGVRRPGLHEPAGLSRVRRRGRAEAEIQEEMVTLACTQISIQYSEVQQDFTLEMEVFYMQFEICHTKNRKQSLKQHIKTSIFEVKLFWTTLYNASWLL